MLITNYICNYDSYISKGSQGFKRVSHHEMDDVIFPNVRDYVFTGTRLYVPPRLDRAGVFAKQFSDFMYDHGSGLDAFKILRPKKFILIYRNPFDAILSRYFYSWKNREGKEDIFSHPRQVIDLILPSFIQSYKKMRHLSADKSRVLLLSYEQLFLQPHSTLINILQFLNIPVYPELIFLSVKTSSMSELRKEEKELGPTRFTQEPKIKGSFARSGKIGEWAEYYSPEDFWYIVSQLEANGINYREFWLTTENAVPPDRYLIFESK